MQSIEGFSPNETTFRSFEQHIVSQGSLMTLKLLTGIWLEKMVLLPNIEHKYLHGSKLGMCGSL